MRNLFKKVFILPIIIILALAFVVYNVKNKPKIQYVEKQLPVKSVEAIELKSTPFSVRAVSFGHVEPATSIIAQSEINGKIVYISPALKKGGLLKAGEYVLGVEPTSFEFSLKQNKAEVERNKFSLTQLEVEEKNTLQFIKIMKANFELGRKDLERSKKLLDQKVISINNFNIAQQKQLQLEQQLEELQAKLQSYPSRKAVIIAQIEKANVQLAQSEDVLLKTKIKVPFDARVGDVFVEKGEFVSVGSKLFAALGIDAVEINAQLPIKQLAGLIASQSDQKETFAINEFQSAERIGKQIQSLKIGAKVELVQNVETRSAWEGEVVRVGEAVDVTTNSVPLVVRVKNPYQNAQPGAQPPLIKGMFVEVTFYTKSKNKLVLPRSAVHEGRIYWINSENKLAISPINIIHKQGDLVLIDDAELIGKKIITSDVIPVIEGQPVKALMNQALQTEIMKDASYSGVNK